MLFSLFWQSYTLALHICIKLSSFRQLVLLKRPHLLLPQVSSLLPWIEASNFFFFFFNQYWINMQGNFLLWERHGRSSKDLTSVDIGNEIVTTNLLLLWLWYSCIGLLELFVNRIVCLIGFWQMLSYCIKKHSR